MLWEEDEVKSTVSLELLCCRLQLFNCGSREGRETARPLDRPSGVRAVKYLSEWSEKMRYVLFFSFLVSFCGGRRSYEDWIVNVSTCNVGHIFSCFVGFLQCAQST